MHNSKNIVITAATIVALLVLGITIAYIMVTRTSSNPEVAPVSTTVPLFGTAPTSTRQIATTTQEEADLAENLIPVGGPQVNFGINKNTFEAGETAQLSWSAPDADSCFAGGDPNAWFFTGNATNGSAQTSAINDDRVFTLVCSNKTGALTVKTLAANLARHNTTILQKVTAPILDLFATRTTTPVDTTSSSSGTTNTNLISFKPVNLANQEHASQDFYADPETINTGETTTLKWKSEHITSCKPNVGPWASSDAALSGTDSLGTQVLTNDSTTGHVQRVSFSLSCTTDKGQTLSRYAYVNVIPAAQVEFNVVTLTATSSSASVATGQDFTLSIISKNTTKCSLRGNDGTNLSILPGKVSLPKPPTTGNPSEFSYSLSCDGILGAKTPTSASASVSVSVKPYQGLGWASGRGSTQGNYGQSCSDHLKEITGHAPVNRSPAQHWHSGSSRWGGLSHGDSWWEFWGPVCSYTKKVCTTSPLNSCSGRIGGVTCEQETTCEDVYAGVFDYNTARSDLAPSFQRTSDWQFAF